MGLNWYERIYARSLIKDGAAENREIFLDAACADGATQQQRHLLEAYYDASTKLLINNVGELETDSTSEDAIKLMMDLVIKDLGADKAGTISHAINDKTGLDLEGKITPDIKEDDLSMERLGSDIFPLIEKGYLGIFQHASGQNSPQENSSEDIKVSSINNGTPEIISNLTHDEMTIGGVRTTEYFARFAHPELAQQRIELAQAADQTTQLTAQNDETYTTTLAV